MTIQINWPKFLKALLYLGKTQHQIDTWKWVLTHPNRFQSQFDSDPEMKAKLNQVMEVYNTLS